MLSACGNRCNDFRSKSAAILWAAVPHPTQEGIREAMQKIAGENTGKIAA
jgi:hypothetical protein